MKIFLAGHTGYIGSAVAAALKAAGHEVVGLSRKNGDIKKPDTWKALAQPCDVLIHAAFEFGADAVAADKAAIEGMVAAARAADAPRLLVYTSGVWVLGPQKVPADEHAPLNPIPLVQWRTAHEKLALAAAGGKIGVAVIRPGCVYGGKAGLYGMMIKGAVEDGKIHVAGDGSNRWASVYLQDLADLYRRVAEKRPDKATYHATDGSAEPVREVAAAFLKAAGRTGDPVPLPLEAARKALGPLADALALDQLVKSDKARNELGWTPELVSAAQNAGRLLAEWRA